MWSRNLVVLLMFLIITIAGCRTAPRVTCGEFFRIYDPGVGEQEPWYINDHCFVRAENGTWHLFGITHAEPLDPPDEDNFAHATAEKLTQVPWKKHPFALTVDPAWKEEHLWAPHVIEHQGLYYMYYCAGDPDHTRYKIHMATSKDLFNWKRHPDNPMVVDGFDARDPFVMKHDGQWIMYYTATSDPKEGQHIVAAAVSKDLIHWNERITVFTDPSVGTWGGPTESPTVVRRGPYFYLFIGPRDDYRGTTVFRSMDPFKWTMKDRVGYLNSHAAEVIRDVDGQWYVSHCGWDQGGVYLAHLYWKDNPFDQDTSMEIPIRSCDEKKASCESKASPGCSEP